MIGGGNLSSDATTFGSIWRLNVPLSALLVPLSAPIEVPLPGKLFKLRGGPPEGGSKRKLLLNKFTATDLSILSNLWSIS